MFESSGIVHWIGLGFTVLVGAVSSAAIYGSLVTRLKVAEKAIDALLKGHDSRGVRMGVVEERVAHIEGRLTERHRND